MSVRFIRNVHSSLKNARRSTAAKSGSSGEKRYPRMRKVVLPSPSPLNVSLGNALRNRSSGRANREGTQLPIGELSTILSHALSKRVDGKRPYPSGGGLFPLETYLVARGVETLPLGVYHYVPSEHALERLWDMPHETHIFSGIPLSKWAELSSAILIFTCVWERSHATYGSFSYVLGLIEAGHAAQNVLLAASALKVGACPIAGINKDEVSSLLDLGEEESPLYSIALAPGATKP